MTMNGRPLKRLRVASERREDERTRNDDKDHHDKNREKNP